MPYSNQINSDSHTPNLEELSHLKTKYRVFKKYSPSSSPWEFSQEWGLLIEPFNKLFFNIGFMAGDKRPNSSLLHPSTKDKAQLLYP